VEIVNQLARQLQHAEHAKSVETLQKKDRLNAAWLKLVVKAEEKKRELNHLAHRSQTFKIECEFLWGDRGPGNS
jgi:hypothetical protein